MRFYAVLFTLLALPPIAYSKTIHVPGDYTKIQSAINAAQNGDTVLVDPGTYLENLDFKNKAITVQSSSGATVTVIDGRRLDSVVQFISGETTDSVLDGFTIKNGSGPNGGGGIRGIKGSSPTIKNNIITGNTSLVEGGGIIFTGGEAIVEDNVIQDNSSSKSGGGINVHFGSQLITGNVISHNTASTRGGALNVYDFSNPLICDNTISNNQAPMGGALYINEYAFPIVRRNRIEGNSAAYDGGAIFVEMGAALVERNVFVDNSAKWGGAVATNLNVFLTVRGNVFLRNTASSKGGAILCENDTNLVACNNLFAENSATAGNGGAIRIWGSYADLKNNTIANNSATMGGGIDFDGSDGSITNTILWNNTAPQGKEVSLSSSSIYVEMSHNNVQGGQAAVYVDPNSTLKWGPGMIDADPLFVEPAADDYHIRYLSLCRDAGDNAAVPHIEDFEGDSRITYGAIDIGADEFANHLYYTGDATPGGNVKLKFVGLPGTNPVALFIGIGVLDPPLASMWGEWYLKFPIMGPLVLAPIPSSGVEIISGPLPGTPPAPYDIPLQALIGGELTNLCIMNVK